MQVHILSLNTPSTPGVGSKGFLNKIKLFQNMVMLHIKLKGMMHAATW